MGLSDKMAASFDVAFDVELFTLALVTEKHGNFFVKIPFPFGVVLDGDDAMPAWRHRFLLPIDGRAAAGGTDIVDGKRLVAGIFKTEIVGDRHALFQVTEIVGERREPFHRCAGCCRGV